MKFAALCVVALGIAIVVAGSCTVNHLSDDFVCNADRTCSSDRTCVDGFCVLTTDAGAACPAQCTSCVAARKVCTIDCSLNGGCSQAIACPAGWNCNVLCNTDSSCQSAINCMGSASCTIMCTSPFSCQSVVCGMGPCMVDCAATGSCRDVNCGPSCACDVTCGIGSSCFNLTCKPGCKGGPKGCTSAGTGCGC